MEARDQLIHNHIRELTPEEARKLFDQEARRNFGISGEEFIKAWESGQFDDEPDQPDLMNLVMMLPTIKESLP